MAYRNSRNFQIKHRANYRSELAPTLYGYTPDPADKRTRYAIDISDLKAGESLGFRTLLDLPVPPDRSEAHTILDLRIPDIKDSKPVNPELMIFACMVSYCAAIVSWIMYLN